MSQQDVARLVAGIDEARAGLRELLRSKDARALAKRPASGEWSIVENVRHLLFAEQLHLGKFLPGRVQWSPVGMTNRTGKAYVDVGTQATDDLEVVFRAWDAVHQPIREAFKGSRGEVRPALERNLKHLAQHALIIEKLLSESPTTSD